MTVSFNPWEILILETAQMGGNLTFIEDQSPHDMTQWMEPLFDLFKGEIPFVRRRREDLSSGRFQTQSSDLIVFFSSQKELVEILNPVLQGQRLLISVPGEKDENLPVDFIWHSCDLAMWTQTLQGVKKKWGDLEPLSDFLDSHKSPCLFLDRDDVVVKNVPYNKEAGLVELMPGIVELIDRAHQKGYWVSLVTNQSGLGRGWVTWPEYQQVHQRMLELLAQKGCWLDECVWAGFYDQEAIPAGRQRASLRKPRVGMFQMVNAKLKVNMRESLMVGDSATDLVAAFGAGVSHLYLLSSDKVDKEKVQLQQFQKYSQKFQFQIIKDFSQVKI